MFTSYGYNPYILGQHSRKMYEVSWQLGTKSMKTGREISAEWC